MNPYDYNPYSPFSSHSIDLFDDTKPFKTVEQVKNIKRPQTYQRKVNLPKVNLQRFDNSACASDGDIDDDDFIEWFLRSDSFLVLLLLVLVIIIMNFIVLATSFVQVERQLSG